MLSFEFFCHKKEEPDYLIQILTTQGGFIQLPEEIEEMFQSKEVVYEGLASINGKNLLAPSLDPLIIEEVEGCQIISPVLEEKAKADNALLANLLDEYAEKHELALSDKTLLQKICLSLNEKISQSNGYVYLNLKNCENAPLILDAVTSLFDGFDILFTLPKNLKFMVPLLKTKRSKTGEKKEGDDLCLEEGYQAFFDDVCGIASPNFDRIEKKKNGKKEKTVQSKKEPLSLKKAIKPAEQKQVFLKPGSKIEKQVKKDLGGYVLFSFIFLGLSIAAPYFYFGLLNQSGNIYFAIYLILDVFFLIMCSAALASITDAKSKVTKGYYYFGILFSPTIEVIAAIAFFFIAKSLSWLGAEAYSFFGLGLGYILLHPLVIWVRNKYLCAKKKAKANK